MQTGESWPVRPLRTSLLAIALASACALLLTAAAGGSGPDSPCRSTPCVAQLKVGPDELKWRSIELFYPANEELDATLTARGRRLALVESWGPGDCRGAYRGSGIVAVAKACGDSTPLRVRAYRHKRKRIRLVVSYRATPVMTG